MRRTASAAGFPTPAVRVPMTRALSQYRGTSLTPAGFSRRPTEKEFCDHTASGLINGTFRCRQRASLHIRQGKPHRAALSCLGRYFDDREAVTFNPDGFVGFAGWAADDNVQPVLEGFADWIKDLTAARMIFRLPVEGALFLTELALRSARAHRGSTHPYFSSTWMRPRYSAAKRAPLGARTPVRSPGAAVGLSFPGWRH